MRVLVLGGTRFFGRLLVRMLAAEGHDVTVWTRGRTAGNLPSNVATVTGDRNDPAAARVAFTTRYDALVDNIAYSSSDVASLAPAASRHVDHYLLTSTAWVYGLAPDESREYVEADLPVDRHSAPGRLHSPLPEATSTYVHGKRAAELAAAALDVPVSVVRPCMVTGPADQNDRIGFYARRVLDGGPVLLADGADKELQLLFAYDLARAMLELLRARPSSTSAYNVAPPALTVGRLVTLVVNALGNAIEMVDITAEELRDRLPTYLDRYPFAVPEPGRYGSSRLLTAFPAFAYTDPDTWVQATAWSYAFHDPLVTDESARSAERTLAAELRSGRNRGALRPM